MSYIDQNLLPDERILYRTKKHFIIFFPALILTILVLYIYTLNNPYLLKFSWLFDIATFIYWGVQWLEYATSEFAVTNKRVMMKEGFFVRHANELRLTTIAQVAIQQSLIGQLLNYGTVGINVFGGSTDVFTLIASPNQFQRYVQVELDKITR